MQALGRKYLDDTRVYRKTAKPIFLELPFEAACLDYHQNVRSVRTASSEQVRQPIYREGLEQWRHYEPWLGELKEKLGDAVVRYRDPSPG